MDWIHCNSCFIQPEIENGNTTKKQFHLTSCGHIFCENCSCFADGTLDCCKRCRNKCSSTMIGEKSFQTNPQVLEYFQEPEEVYEKLLKVMKFQKAHRIKLVGHHQYIISKYKRAKLYIKKLEGELKIAKNALRNTPQYQHSVTESLSISTPLFQPNSTPFNMINAEANIHNTPAKMKIKMPDMRHRKQSFRNELSILSTGSNASEVSTPGSSVYASPMQETCNEKYMPTIDNLQLNSFGHKYLK
ncbi:zip homologous protein 2 isoform X1 [Rhopalosiphum padi]|uniref:zip homologous protein 2 isoform X1 n=1 Tax=Rhopalosiphum padi TaxID=40932 RepID=UPI00298E08EC|nr:zip homologous protein 2 isoform X1 [Rhopalosiphum padi]